jgi:hypothetical protein
MVIFVTMYCFFRCYTEGFAQMGTDYAHRKHRFSAFCGHDLCSSVRNLLCLSERNTRLICIVQNEVIQPHIHLVNYIAIIAVHLAEAPFVYV